MCLVAWLTIMLSFGLNPFEVSSSKYFLYASNIVFAHSLYWGSKYAIGFVMK